MIARLYILFLLLFSNDVASQIEFNGEIRRFDGVVLFQSAADPLGYYYLPEKLRIAKDKNGRKSMAHYKYVSKIDSISGSIFYVELDFNVAPVALQKAKDALERSIPGAYIIGKLPIYNLDQNKQVFTKLKLQSSAFQSTVEAYAPIFNYAKSAYSLRMTKHQTALFEKSLTLAASDLSLSFESFIYANVKDCTINISANKELLKSTFSEVEFEEKKMREHLSGLYNSNKLKIISKCSGWIESQLNLDMVMDYITATLFEKTESDTGKYVFKPAILKSNKEFTLAINNTSQLKLPFSASCNLTLEEGEQLREYQALIYLPDKTNDKKELIFQLGENIKEAFDQSLTKLEVEVRSNGKLLNDRIHFTHQDVKNGAIKKSKFVSSSPGGKDLLEYRLSWGVKNQKNRIVSSWKKAALFNPLVPPLNALSTTIVVDPNPLKDYRFIRYDFYAKGEKNEHLQLYGASVSLDQQMYYQDVQLYYPRGADLYLTTTYVPKYGAQKENTKRIEKNSYTIFIKPLNTN